MKYRALIVAFLALCLGVLTACSQGSVSATSRDQLTYDQIKGTGLANLCPQLAETTRGSIAVEPGKTYQFTNMCIQPIEYFVKEEPTNIRQAAEFVPVKLLTRETTTLDQISGTITVNEDKSLTLTEEDGIDFQNITIQMPGGRRVPFFFTVKSLVAQTPAGFDSINRSVDFEGQFKVPPGQTASYLDTKGRGLAAGYDNAVALPAQADEFTKKSIKQFPIGKGEISLQVAKVDQETGEIAGTFVSLQPSDTKFGTDEPEEVKISGIFYARVGSQMS